MLQLVIAPNPKLRIQTKQVKKINSALLQTLKEMIKLTKTFNDPEGVGLASTQVGLGEAFFVAKNGEKFLSVVNPKLISRSKRTKKFFEGCLSIPNMWGEVSRSLTVKVTYGDIEGNTIVKTLTGLMAHIFQHEIDHLNGILFPERVLQQKGKFYKFTGKDKTGADTFEEVTL